MNRVSQCGVKHPRPLYTFEESLPLKAKVDAYLDKKIQEWKSSVPYANHLEEKKVNSEWYKRHTIEHVWRIRLSRTVQCRALYAMAKHSPEAAQLYAKYQEEEMLHDTLYSQDLNSMGVSNEEIWATEPLLSTRLLEGFLYFIAEHEDPIGVVCYGYLVEYTTKVITPTQLEAMKKSLGENKIEGQLAHMNTDLVEDHAGEMWKIMNSLIFDKGAEQRIYKYFDEVQKLLAMYFQELYQVTVEKSLAKSE